MRIKRKGKSPGIMVDPEKEAQFLRLDTGGMTNPSQVRGNHELGEPVTH